jgi:hypothetical protein
MLNKVIKHTQKRWQQIKLNDIVIVKDQEGNETIGTIKEYTPDNITLEVVEYKKFDAKKVTMEKVN